MNHDRLSNSNPVTYLKIYIVIRITSNPLPISTMSMSDAFVWVPAGNGNKLSTNSGTWLQKATHINSYLGTNLLKFDMEFKLIST